MKLFLFTNFLVTFAFFYAWKKSHDVTKDIYMPAYILIDNTWIISGIAMVVSWTIFFTKLLENIK